MDKLCDMDRVYISNQKQLVIVSILHISGKKTEPIIIQIAPN